MTTKKDLLIIVSASVLISFISIATFVNTFGAVKIVPQILRLGLTLLLCYFLYQEKQWARWICVVLFLISGLGGVLGTLKIGFSLDTLPLFLISAFYLAVAVYLGSIRKWNIHNV